MEMKEMFLFATFLGHGSALFNLPFYGTTSSMEERYSCGIDEC
jgi:hypothetical protein